jgi:hypothetical protein
MQDLVFAAVATSQDPALNFGLSLLEGELDVTGWPMRARLVVETSDGAVAEVDELFPVNVHLDSPIRNREPEVFVDDTPGSTSVPETVKWMRSKGHRFMAIFPLFCANQPIGLFHLMAKKILEHSPGD